MVTAAHRNGKKVNILRKHSDWFIATALFAVTVITRIPFVSSVLYVDDSTGFALAVDDFDLAKERPHPPGYILYIMLGRVFNVFTNDANTALVALGVFSAAVAVAGIYFLGKTIFGRGEGLIAALLLLFSPLFWLYSEVALSYSVSVPLALLITWLLYETFFNRRYAILCGLIMGLAAGVRQDLLIYYAPVLFFASMRVGWRRMLLSWGAAAAGVFAWLVPLILSVGDLGRFIEIQSLQYQQAVLPDSFFQTGASALAVNAKEILKAALWLLGPALLALIVAGARVFRRDHRTIFLFFCALPSLAVFQLFFIDPPAYLLICAPSLVLLAAQGISIVSRGVVRVIGDVRVPFFQHAPIKEPVLAAALVLMSSWACVVLFLSGSQTLDRLLPGTPGYEFLFITHNANGIAARSESILAAIDAVEQYDPETTVVVCNIADNVFDWSRLMYYLPEYRVIGIHLLDGIGGGAYKDGIDHENLTQGGGTIELAPEVERLVFIGQDINQDYLELSDDVVVKQGPLVQPDRFAPSLIAVIEPLDESLQLGIYTFRRAGD